jgi:ribonuclease-3 family protein
MHEKTIGTALPSVAALSYLGDARHSLYVREMLVKRGISKSGELNKLSLGYVTAEAQAGMYRKIEPYLADDERDVFRRASNSTHLNRPKHASITDYRYATGFEALFGYLYLCGYTDRLKELFKISANKHYQENNK